ncbi:gp61 DNA primase subunit [Acinetobacter phage 133]|uniref:Gp61 DNA primase subunit n=1 Tax=Acinetobacter phage 133 TaxID=2919552 RepID=D9I615_9CAUD|nr:gp61 DNA primase subunit [Acinetobacter phage 133]ADJ19396.1 gp61 DNA primase subunit [Acinetobacter phage 133]
MKMPNEKLDDVIKNLHKIILNWGSLQSGLCEAAKIYHLPAAWQYALIDMWHHTVDSKQESRIFPIGGCAQYAREAMYGEFNKNMSRLHYVIWFRNALINIKYMLNDSPAIAHHWKSFPRHQGREARERWISFSITQYNKYFNKGANIMRISSAITNLDSGRYKILMNLSWVPFEICSGTQGVIGTIKCQDQVIAFNKITGVTGSQGDRSLAKRTLLDLFCNASEKTIA